MPQQPLHCTEITSILNCVVLALHCPPSLPCDSALTAWTVLCCPVSSPQVATSQDEKIPFVYRGMGPLLEHLREVRRRHLRSQMKTLNKLRQCARLGRRTSLHQQLLVLMSDTAYHPRLPAVLNTLLHRKNSVQQIIHTLTRAVQYVPRYTEMEKDLGLLTWRLGGPQLLYAFNAAGLLPQWGVLRDLHKQSHLVMGPDVTAADILRILPDDLPFSAIYIVIDEVAVDGRIRVLVQDGVARLYGFCHEHCGPVELQSEDAAYDLQEKLLDGTVHRATVGTVVLLVPMNEKYHRGFPLMLYGSCNRFDSDMMVSLLTGITRAFESPELAARGRIMGLGTDGDARRAAAHIRCLVPTSAAAIVLPGVAAWPHI